MSFAVPNDLESALGLADDICAIAYAMYHDKDLVVGLWGYHDREYSIDIKRTVYIPPEKFTREIIYEGYFSVLGDKRNTQGSLFYGSTINGGQKSCVLLYDGTEGSAHEYMVRSVSAYDHVKLPDMSYHGIVDLNVWSDEYYFQQSLVLTDWEILGAIIFSTLKYEGVLSLRVDIGHMCAIIEGSSKDKLLAVREFYARRDKTKESPLFDSESSS